MKSRREVCPSSIVAAANDGRFSFPSVALLGPLPPNCMVFRTFWPFFRICGDSSIFRIHKICCVKELLNENAYASASVIGVMLRDGFASHSIAWSFLPAGRSHRLPASGWPLLPGVVLLVDVPLFYRLPKLMR